MIKRDDCGKTEIQRVMDKYASETAFSNPEKTLTAAMIVFPWKFMSLCNEYYNKRKAFTFDASVQRIERCTEAIEKEEEIINCI